MSGLTGADIVRLIKSDREALRELATSIASESELRLALVNAALAEVATKKDLERVENALRRDMEKLWG